MKATRLAFFFLFRFADTFLNESRLLGLDQSVFFPDMFNCFLGLILGPNHT